MTGSSHSDHRNPDGLIDRLERQKRLCDELAELARRQSTLIESADVDGLLDLLRRRQALIDRLLQAQRADGVPAPNALPSAIEALPDHQRARARSLIESIGAGLAEIERFDSRDQEALQARLQEVGREISSANTANTAVKAYGRAHTSSAGLMSPGTRFTDQQG